MSARHRTLVLGLLAATFHHVAPAQQTDPVGVLIEQGQYWQSRGNGERAAEAWQKLLRIDATQADALYGLGVVELERNRPEAARDYLAQLRRAHPSSALVGRLDQAITLGGNTRALEDARQLARSGEAGKAVAAYEQALDGKTPQGALALEYYQTLAGTPQGWATARQGFERLVRENPKDTQAALALAQHLTYREETRRDGIQRLAALARQPGVGAEVTNAWRQGLVWMGTDRADAPLYQAFLDVNPNDAAIRARLDEISRQQADAQRAAQAANDPLRRRATDGFRALDTGNVAQAETDFEAVLAKRPNDPDALGGLGVLRLRQERFTEARDLLQRASRQGSPGRWRSALNSASYWSLVEEGTAARDAGNLQGARRLLEQAVKLDAAEASGQNALADTLGRSGDFNEAEAVYRRVLTREPANADALRGLVGVLSQNNRPDEALAIIDRMTPEQQQGVGEVGQLRAAQAVGAAKAASARGDDNSARIALEDALLNDPNSPWIRLDLARLYMKMGATNEARGVMDGLLVSNPDMPEALYASALLAAEMQDWTGALATLERVPPQNRTRDMGTLQRRAWVHAQAERASALAAQGNTREALAALAQAEMQAGQDPELLGALATAYSDAGDSNRAIGMIRQLMARTTRPGEGIRLQYASILLKTGQDVELAGILRQMNPAQMTYAERQSFEDIRVAYVIRQADALREAGDLAGAYDVLAPVLADRPNDAAAIGSLARMYEAAGDSAQALALYTDLLRRTPNDVQLMVSAANVATAAKDYRFAESTLDAALAQAPQNPEVLSAAGRLYRVQGKNSKATQYFTAAVEAENAQRRNVARTPGAGAPMADARSSNPFAGRTGSRPPAARVAMQGGAPAGNYVAQVDTYGSAPGQAYIPVPAGANRFAPAPATDPYVQQGYTPYGASNSAPSSYYQDSPASRPVTPPGNRLPPAPRGNNRPAAAPAYHQANAAPAQGYGAQPSYAPSAYVPTPYAQPGGQSAPLPASQAPSYEGPYFGTRTRAAARMAPAEPGPRTPPPWAPGGTDAALGPRTAQDELNAIRQERSPTVAIGPTLRSRQGEAGMSELTEMSAPVEMQLPAGDGKIAMRVTPVALDAGTPSGDYPNGSRFGGGPAAALAQQAGTTGGAGSQSESGVGLSVAYLGERVEAELGSTPLGFRYTDFTGGLRLKGPFAGNWNYDVDFSRRPVTDSLLAFAGARDARTGQSWGGVSSTGARMQIGYDNGEYGLYGYGSFHSLSGHNVESNSRIEGGGGVYVRLMQDADSDLTGGLNVTALSYDKNLRYFTYGHGGYFSPQSFLAMSVPVTWNQRSGRLRYQIRGSLGVQHFTEDDADYFPGNAGLQAAAQAAVGAAGELNLGGPSSAIYGGQSKTGLGYNLGAAVEYQLAPQLTLGGHLAMDNASDYRQFIGGMYLRYAFEPATASLAPLPVTPFKSSYSY